MNIAAERKRLGQVQQTGGERIAVLLLGMVASPPAAVAAGTSD
jgi:hypothetical protein